MIRAARATTTKSDNNNNNGNNNVLMMITATVEATTERRRRRRRRRKEEEKEDRRTSGRRRVPATPTRPPAPLPPTSHLPPVSCTQMDVRGTMCNIRHSTYCRGLQFRSLHSLGCICYLAGLQQIQIRCVHKWSKEGNTLFNDALNTCYLWWFGFEINNNRWQTEPFNRCKILIFTCM